MTAITPGTHLVVGDPFTETIPAGTPFIRIWADGDVRVLLRGATMDRDPVSGESTAHHLTVEAPVPTPDKFQPGTRVAIEFDYVNIGDGTCAWVSPGGIVLADDESDVKAWIVNDFARLTHVPTPPTRTRQDAVDALAGLGWTTDAIEDAIGAQGDVDVRGGGEA